MRANEFINEGWYDDAKNKVKQVASSPIGQKIGGLAKSAGTAIANKASSVAQGAIAGAKTAGTAVGQALNPTSQAAVANRSTQIFIKKFIDSYNATKNRQAQLKKPFDLASFANAYMAQYKWEPGELADELAKAAQTNDPKQAAMVMDKIGALNTVDPNAKGPEINMAQPAPAATTQPEVQISVGGKPGEAMNPNDPTDAKILAMLKQQGKI
jgi:hypothetical protein